MNIGDINVESTSSLKQALGIAAMRKSMNRDAATVSTLLNDMQAANSKVMENSITPHLGKNIDARV